MEEIQVPEDTDSSITSLLSSGTKKRKKDRRRSPLENSSLGDSLAENLDKLENATDKCKSPNSKKLKLNDIVNNPDDNSISKSKSKRLGSKEKDIINYLNENFSDSPKPVVVSREVGDSVNVGDKKTEKTDADADYFKAIPVAVRQPLKLPRHASNILSSRNVGQEEDKVIDNEKEEEDALEDDVEGSDVEGSDVECSLLSDLDDSDSELESLVR